MNTELRKQAKNDFEKYFFKLINNSAFFFTSVNIGYYLKNWSNGAPNRY